MWLKGDFHVHSTHSGDATSWGDDITGVIKAANANGLDFIALSDHRTSACLTDPEFLAAQTSLVLIPGEEWGGPGHAGAHGLTRAPIMDEQDETQGAAVACQKIQQSIDDIHSMGGVFVLNHAIDNKIPWIWPANAIDGVEVWNQSWGNGNAADMTLSTLHGFTSAHGLDVAGGPSHMPEVDQAIATTGGGTNWQRLHLYEAHLAAGRHIAAVGGGDTHYVFLPGWPTTVVYASGRSPADVIEGVREGRTLVQRAPDAPPVDFTADVDGKGTFDRIIGDRIPLGHPVTLRIHVRQDQGGKIQLVRNGTIAQEWTVASNDFSVDFPDQPSVQTWYRINVLEPLDYSIPNAQVLEGLVRGTTSIPILQALLSTGILGSSGSSIANALNSGIPALPWLLIDGTKVGVSVSSGTTRYPRLFIPPVVSRWLNLAIHEHGLAMGVVSSPIWVE
jgi:hypothetical protein